MLVELGFKVARNFRIVHRHALGKIGLQRSDLLRAFERFAAYIIHYITEFAFALRHGIAVIADFGIYRDDTFGIDKAVERLYFVVDFGFEPLALGLV